MQPETGKPYPRPAVPRGWKMGELLPYMSAAMTGGGVSENLFKDMMKEMQGGGDPMSALMGAAAGGEDGGNKILVEQRRKVNKCRRGGKKSRPGAVTLHWQWLRLARRALEARRKSSGSRPSLRRVSPGSVHAPY